MEMLFAVLAHLVPLLYGAFFGWSGMLSDPDGWVRMHWAEIQPFACGFATWGAFKLSLLAPSYDLQIVVLGMAVFTGATVMNWYWQAPRFWMRMR